MEELSAGGSGRAIRFSGGDIFVAERGAGLPVVALHAIGHGSGDFLPLAERVGSRFRLWMIDWPGHGWSARGVAPNVWAYERLLAEVIPQLSSEPVILLGNSIGAAAALVLAARSPALVRGLALCDPAGLVALGRAQRLLIDGFVRFFEAGARGAWWFPAAFRAYYRFVLPRREAAARRGAICAASASTAALLAEAWRSFGEPVFDLRHLVPRVTAPVWIAWAKHDCIVSWRASRRAAEGFVRHTVTHFPGGHSPFIEAPDDFAAVFSAMFAGGGLQNSLRSGRMAGPPTGE